MATSDSSAPNWLGLLKWSLAHSDGTSPTTDAHAMSEEDKQFLERALKEGVKDEPARMQEIMAEVVSLLDTQGCAAQGAHLEDVLEELRDITEQIDMARVFVRFGGLQCLMGLLESPEPLTVELRSVAAGVIGTLAQNNLEVQDAIFTQGTVDRLARLCLATDTAALAAKVLYAISCIVRNHAAAEAHFILQHSAGLFTRALAPKSVGGELPPPVLARRAVFLANALINSDVHGSSGSSSSSHGSDGGADRLREVLVPVLVPAVLPYVNGPDVDLREGSLRLLTSLALTASGRECLQSAAHAEALEATLCARQGSQIGDDGFDEQEVHEQALVAELRAALVAPLVAAATNAVTAPSTASATDESTPLPPPLPAGEAAPPVLLLQPPALHAASVPP